MVTRRGVVGLEKAGGAGPMGVATRGVACVGVAKWKGVAGRVGKVGWEAARQGRGQEIYQWAWPVALVGGASNSLTSVCAGT